MPIKKNEEKLRELTEKALLVDDIKNNLSKGKHDVNSLVEKVLAKSQEIWNEGITVEAELVKLEKESPISRFASKRKKKEFYDREKKFQEDFDKLVIDKGILPLLREIINKELQPSYEFILLKFRSTGLSEIFNPSYEINTSAKKRLQFMLNNMPGGSIGLAGPRGVGKSTLIRSVCTGSDSTIKGKEVFAVMTSAPVEYGARDFMLHIFAMVCNKILAKFDPENQGVLGHNLQDLRKPLLESVLILLKRLRTLSIIVGFVFLLLGPFIAGIDERNLIVGSLMTKTDTPEQPQTTQVGGEAVKNTKPEQPQTTQVGGEAVKNTKPDEDKNTWTQAAKGFAGSLIGELKLRAFKISKWGLTLILSGIVFTIVIFLIPGGKISWKDNPYNFLVNQAKEAIKEIKFQQTYTTGWIGSLKFPLAASGTIEEAVSLAKKQLSLPEIVDAFLNFLKQISKEFRIIIGIDELDKLESDEKAMLFINEVKAFFGLEDCFYLISVSESAMSNFERRGLPFRDSFDSAFDDVLHVDYLSLEEAKWLLWRRVVGTPIPFICLCYCISGGLAREIIRVYRDLLELVEPNPKALDELSRTLLKSEMIMKIKATMISAKKLNLVDPVTIFVDYLLKLELSLESIESFRSKFWELAPIFLKGQGHASVAEEFKSELVRLNSLGQDLVAYLYYSLTLIDFFNERLNEMILKDAIDKGFIDKLAKARQSQMINYKLSITLVNEFRKQYNLAQLVEKKHAS